MIIEPGNIAALLLLNLAIIMVIAAISGAATRRWGWKGLPVALIAMVAVPGLFTMVYLKLVFTSDGSVSVLAQLRWLIPMTMGSAGAGIWFGRRNR